MQLLNSAIKIFEDRLWGSSDAGDQRAESHWGKVARCTGYIIHHSYDQFQTIKLSPSEKRRCLLTTLPRLSKVERENLLDQLPTILPDQRMRSSLISDSQWKLSLEQIQDLQLTDTVSIALLKNLIRDSPESVSWHIVNCVSRSLYSHKKIRALFKALVEKQADNQMLMQRLFQKISFHLFPSDEQYRCARSCFKIYGEERGKDLIRSVSLSCAVIAAFPWIDRLDPAQLLGCGYAPWQLQIIYTHWVEEGDEQVVFLARGKREAWGVNQEQMRVILESVGKIAPRNHVKRVYRNLDSADRKRLEEVGFKSSHVNDTHSHLLFCNCLLNHPQVLLRSKKSDQLIQLLCSTAKVDTPTLIDLLDALQNGLTIPSASRALAELFKSIIKQLSDAELVIYSETMLGVLEDRYLFPVMSMLAKRQAAHYAILSHMCSFSLPSVESKVIAHILLKHGNEISGEALLETLVHFKLSPEETVDLIFEAIDRFPSLATIPLFKINEYKLPDEARRDFLLRWNERHLIPCLAIVMGTAFFDLPLKTEELQRLFIDAFNGLALQSPVQSELVLQRFRDVKFSLNTRKLLAQMLIHEGKDDAIRGLEAFILDETK